jgi:hypothetical protein
MPFYLHYEIGNIAEVQDLMPVILENDKERQVAIKTIVGRGNDNIFALVRDLDELHENGKIPLATSEKIMVALACVIDVVKEDLEPFSIQPVHRVYWLIINWINRSPENYRASLLIKVITKSLRGGAMYLPLILNEKIGIEMGWITPDQGQQKSSKPFNFSLDDAQKESLEKAFQGEIRQWNFTNPPRWFDHSRGASMLFIWLRFEKNYAEQTLKEWINDDYKLVQILNLMIGIGYRNDERYEYINPYGLERLIGMNKEQIVKRVHKISGQIHIAEKFPKVFELVDKLPDILPASGEFTYD